MADFQSFRASLASVSIIPPRERTRSLNGRCEGGCRCRFSLATALRCFSTSLAALWAVEPSPVGTNGSVTVCESWEARDRIAMSMSSFKRPLAADPKILMSFLRWAQVMNGSRWPWTPSNVARAIPTRSPGGRRHMLVPYTQLPRGIHRVDFDSDSPCGAQPMTTKRAAPPSLVVRTLSL
jgi:hypothetical protein